MNTITVLPNGRFISEHIGATVYHDSRHRVFKVKCEGNSVLELVRECTSTGDKDQLMTIQYSGKVTILDCRNGAIS